MGYRAVDVMGFAGGFTLGVVQAGFELVGKREMKGGFGVANCEANRHLLGDSWRAEVGDAATWLVPHGGVDLVFGNPPCSGFSVMSAKHFRGADSPINHCMWAFAGYVARALPTIAAFESVQMARTRVDGLDLMRRLRAHVEELTGRRWDLHHVRHNAYSVGGAAQRRRYFWVISQVPFGVEVPRPTRVPTLNEVVGDLAGLANSWQAQPYRRPPTWWSRGRRADAGVVDGMTIISNPLTTRIGSLMTSVGWRPGEHIAKVARRYYDEHGCLPRSFAAFEKKIIDNDFNMGFTTPVRWNGEHAARVITGGSLLTTVHPTLDRMITMREAARVMGFPDDWRILPLRGQSGLVATWGKGITVDCGRWLGEWVRRALDGDPGTHTGVALGEREWDIDVTHAWKSAT
jgi:DNA (cytosine-5)-methyltransferase 1